MISSAANKKKIIIIWEPGGALSYFQFSPDKTKIIQPKGPVETEKCPVINRSPAVICCTGVLLLRVSSTSIELKTFWIPYSRQLYFNHTASVFIHWQRGGIASFCLCGTRILSSSGSVNHVCFYDGMIWWISFFLLSLLVSFFFSYWS